MNESELLNIKELINSNNIELAFSLIEGRNLDELEVMKNIIKLCNIKCDNGWYITFNTIMIVQAQNIYRAHVPHSIVGNSVREIWFYEKKDLTHTIKSLLKQLKHKIE